jgi:hypothetical protein
LSARLPTLRNATAAAAPSVNARAGRRRRRGAPGGRSWGPFAGRVPPTHATTARRTPCPRPTELARARCGARKDRHSAIRGSGARIGTDARTVTCKFQCQVHATPHRTCRSRRGCGTEARRRRRSATRWPARRRQPDGDRGRGDQPQDGVGTSLGGDLRGRWRPRPTSSRSPGPALISQTDRRSATGTIVVNRRPSLRATPYGRVRERERAPRVPAGRYRRTPARSVRRSGLVVTPGGTRPVTLKRTASPPPEDPMNRDRIRASGFRSRS